MTNTTNENFDPEDRDFYAEGQRVSSDSTGKTDPLNRDQNKDSDSGEKYNSSSVQSAQDEDSPERYDQGNSLQNDFYHDPNDGDSDNNPNRRTLDEHSANKNEPDEDTGLENDAVISDSTNNDSKDPLDYETDDDYEIDDLDDVEDEDLENATLRDAFNDDSINEKGQSDFENKDFDTENKIRYSDPEIEKQNPNINDPDPFQPKRF